MNEPAPIRPAIDTLQLNRTLRTSSLRLHLYLSSARRTRAQHSLIVVAPSIFPPPRPKARLVVQPIAIIVMRSVNTNQYTLHTTYNTQAAKDFVLLVAVDGMETPCASTKPYYAIEVSFTELATRRTMRERERGKWDKKTLTVDDSERSTDSDEYKNQSERNGGDVQVAAPLRGEKEGKHEEQRRFAEAGEECSELRAALGGQVDKDYERPVAGRGSGVCEAALEHGEGVLQDGSDGVEMLADGLAQRA